MDEIKNATAEQLQTLNPELAEEIAKQAVAAERERMRRIDRITPKGAKYAQMAKEAKENGTSVEDFLAAIVEEQEKAGEEYLSARAKETETANHVGGGDSGDHDDPEETARKAAKEIAELAAGQNVDAVMMM